jgi:putative hydrolase of the HAD superfamily
MPKNAFAHVTNWVFDLDHTLYPPSARLFDQIEVRMTQWMMDELGVDRARADYLRKHYWEVHGTTLAGLMREHDIDPTPYLTHVHDIDFGVLTPDPELRAGIDNLPGRRIVYTNGNADYARKVIAARGLDGAVAEVYGIEHAGYLPKPEQAAFETIFSQDGVEPTLAAMFEDDPRNLLAPHAMGMKTVHIADKSTSGEHIHYHTPDLATFLTQLV